MTPPSQPAASQPVTLDEVIARYAGPWQIITDRFSYCAVRRPTPTAREILTAETPGQLAAKIDAESTPRRPEASAMDQPQQMRPQAAHPPRRTPARPDLLPSPDPGHRPVTGTPGGALIALMEELTRRGFPPAGMNLTRLHGTLTLPSGLAIRYTCGWLTWPTGHTNQRGRPLHALHDAHDSAGAARRLASTAQLRTAQEQATTAGPES